MFNEIEITVSKNGVYTLAFQFIGLSLATFLIAVIINKDNAVLAIMANALSLAIILCKSQAACDIGTNEEADNNNVVAVMPVFFANAISVLLMAVIGNGWHIEVKLFWGVIYVALGLFASIIVPRMDSCSNRRDVLVMRLFSISAYLGTISWLIVLFFCFY